MKNTHYYSKEVTVKSDRNEVKFDFKGNWYTFITDSGVFSKKAVDFGSRVMIENFVPRNSDAPILDMGCGYGPIGTIIGKTYNKEFYMYDINERAVELSKLNTSKNSVQAVVGQSDGFSDVEKIKFSQIITNPPIRAGKKVYYEIYKNSIKYLEPLGELWVVIQKKQGAETSKVELESIFGNCSVIAKKKGYFILKSVFIPLD